MSRDTDLAWAAGLYEGEGSVSMLNRPGDPPDAPRTARGRRKPCQYQQASMQTADEDVLRRFAAIVGMGNVYTLKPRPGREHHKQLWGWNAYGYEKVAALFDMLGPWLGERRTAKFREVLGLCCGCGGGFGAPSDRTTTTDGRDLCRPCADADPTVGPTPW